MVQLTFSGNPPGTTYVIRETYNTTNRTQGHPPPQNHNPNEPGKTIIYRHETHSTNNSYDPGYPNGPSSRIPPEVETFDVDRYGRHIHEYNNLVGTRINSRDCSNCDI